MNWFEDWFNSKYYHLLYKDRNEREAQEFIDALLRFLKLPKQSNILDLACGKGRHSVYINKLGYNVTGLDLAENSIKWAKKFETESLQFGVHDMREVYKEKTFDAIFNFFTSFGYFDDEKDNQKIFDSVRKQLKNNGLFVIDFLNATKVIENLVAEEEKTVEGVVFIIRRFVENGKINKEIRFFAEDKNWYFKEQVAAIKEQQFLDYTKKANFKILHVFGDYDLQEYDENKSNRLILVMQKN